MTQSAPRPKSPFSKLTRTDLPAFVAGAENLDLAVVARCQRLLLLSILLYTLGVLGVQILVGKTNAPVAFNVLFYVAVMAFSAWVTYRAGKALRVRLVWLWVLGMVPPYLSQFLLMLLNLRAVMCLREAGYRVTLWKVEAPTEPR